MRVAILIAVLFCGCIQAQECDFSALGDEYDIFSCYNTTGHIVDSSLVPINGTCKVWCDSMYKAVGAGSSAFVATATCVENGFGDVTIDQDNLPTCKGFCEGDELEMKPNLLKGCDNGDGLLSSERTALEGGSCTQHCADTYLGFEQTHFCDRIENTTGTFFEFSGVEINCLATQGYICPPPVVESYVDLVGCTNLTLGEVCNTVCAQGHRGADSTMTCGVKLSDEGTLAVDWQGSPSVCEPHRPLFKTTEGRLDVVALSTRGIQLDYVTDKNVPDAASGYIWSDTQIKEHVLDRETSIRDHVAAESKNAGDRMDGIDKTIQDERVRVNGEFAKDSTRMDGIDKTIQDERTRVNGEFAKHSSRMNGIDSTISTTDSNLRTLVQNTKSDLVNKIGKLETDVYDEIDDTKQDLQQEIDDDVKALKDEKDSDIHTVNTKITNTNNALNKAKNDLGKDIDAVDARVDSLQGSLNTAKQDITTVNNRVTSVNNALNGAISGLESRLSKSISDNVKTLNSRIDGVAGTANSALSTANTAKNTANSAQNTANSVTAKLKCTKNCAKGQYYRSGCDTNGNPSCVNCPSGQWSKGGTNYACSACTGTCGAGTYFRMCSRTSDTGKSSCHTCPSNTYRPQSGHKYTSCATCTRCSSGWTTYSGCTKTANTQCVYRGLQHRGYGGCGRWRKYGNQGGCDNGHSWNGLAGMRLTRGCCWRDHYYIEWRSIMRYTGGYYSFYWAADDSADYYIAGYGWRWRKSCCCDTCGGRSSRFWISKGDRDTRFWMRENGGNDWWDFRMWKS